MRPKNFSTFMVTYDTLYGWKDKNGFDKLKLFMFCVKFLKFHFKAPLYPRTVPNVIQTKDHPDKEVADRILKLSQSSGI